MGKQGPQRLFVRTMPYLIVRRLQEHILFFTDRLGFEVAEHDPRTRVAIVCRDDVCLILRETAVPQPLPTNAGYAPGSWPADTEPYDAGVIVTDVDKVHADLVNRQAKPTKIEHRGYGRDTSVVLPDGHVLVFLQFV